MVPQNASRDCSIPRDPRSRGARADARESPNPAPLHRGRRGAWELGAEPLNRNTLGDREAFEVSSVRAPDPLPELSHSRPSLPLTNFVLDLFIPPGTPQWSPASGSGGPSSGWRVPQPWKTTTATPGTAGCLDPRRAQAGWKEFLGPGYHASRGKMRGETWAAGPDAVTPSACTGSRAAGRRGPRRPRRDPSESGAGAPTPVPIFLQLWTPKGTPRGRRRPRWSVRGGAGSHLPALRVQRGAQSQLPPRRQLGREAEARPGAPGAARPGLRSPEKPAGEPPLAPPGRPQLRTDPAASRVGACARLPRGSGEPGEGKLKIKKKKKKKPQKTKPAPSRPGDRGRGGGGRGDPPRVRGSGCA